MSVNKSVQKQSPAASVKLAHFLSQCRFDLQRRTWDLPALAVVRDNPLLFLPESAALWSALSKTILNFPTLPWEVKQPETAHDRTMSGNRLAGFRGNRKTNE